MERKVIKVSEIYNFIDNPRTEKAKNSFDEIKKLYGDTSSSRKNLINLAKNIAEKGYDATEAIVVVIENDKYVAYDGNRRIAALKLLISPEKFDFLLNGDKNSLENFANSGVIPQTIEVVVKSKQDALDYMQRVHGGEQNGVGHKEWNAENKRRFSERNGGYILTNELDKAFQKEFGTKITEELPVTTIDRILKNKEVQSALNIEKEQKDFPRNQLEEVRNALQIAKEIAESENQSVTRAFATKKDIINKLIPRINTRKEKIYHDTLAKQKSTKKTKVITEDLFTLINNLPADSSNNSIQLVIKLMIVLDELWKKNKERYNVVIAPSLRSIFEISFNELRNKQLFKLTKDSKIDENTLNDVVNEMSKSGNLTTIAKQLEQSFRALKTQFSKNGNEISKKYILSHDGAHRSNSLLSNDDLKNIANKAELFSIVSLKFVLLEGDNEK